MMKEFSTGMVGRGATGGGRAPWWGGRVSDHREGWYNWNMHPGPGTLSPSQGPQYPLSPVQLPWTPDGISS